MGERKELGHIQRATFGYGGYDDAMVGLDLTLGGPAWGVGFFLGAWASGPGANAEWTVEDQRHDYANAVILLRDTLKAAKKHDVTQLAGTPVECTFDGNRLTSWRVLTEVIA